MVILFVCNQGKHRSRTACDMFGGQYCGIYSESHPVTAELLNEANTIVVMENIQREWIGEHFPKAYLAKRIVCLDIPDIYSHGQDKLKRLLTEKSHLWQERKFR